MYLQGCGSVSVDKPEPNTKKPSLNRLVGLEARQITQLLGSPDFKHKELSSEMWQYNNDFCQLNIFIYTQKSWEVIATEKEIESRKDIVLRKNKVEYVDFQKIDLTEENKTQCLNFLLRRNKKN